MNKKTILSIFLTTIIALTIIIWIFQSQPNPVKTNVVRIETFSLTEIWEYLGGLSIIMPFNLTLHNTGINEVSGLNLSIAIFVNDTSKIETVFLDVPSSEERLSPHNFTLLAGEAQELEGWIGTTMYALELAGAKNVSIGGVNSGWNYVATVKLGDEVLDEYIIDR
jgi:hypothetical protein